MVPVHRCVWLKKKNKVYKREKVPKLFNANLSGSVSRDQNNHEECTVIIALASVSLKSFHLPCEALLLLKIRMLNRFYSWIVTKNAFLLAMNWQYSTITKNPHKIMKIRRTSEDNYLWPHDSSFLGKDSWALYSALVGAGERANMKVHPPGRHLALDQAEQQSLAKESLNRASNRSLAFPQQALFGYSFTAFCSKGPPCASRMRGRFCHNKRSAWPQLRHLSHLEGKRFKSLVL